MATEIPTFVGGWSYTQKEMNELFKHISFTENFSVLEFGSGASTILLFDFFKKHVKELTFVTYESNCEFFKPHPGIQYVYYDENYMSSVRTPCGSFDLILIDGPNGDKRSLWYSKIRNNVKPGTIILVDDFNHYSCFSEELDRNFNYEVLDHHEEPFVAYGEHSWKIVRVISLK